MHYRVSIRLRGNDGHGHRDREREIHVDRPVPDGPMQKTLQAYPKRATVLIGVCWASLDDSCDRYGKPEGQPEGQRGPGASCAPGAALVGASGEKRIPTRSAEAALEE